MIRVASLVRIATERLVRRFAGAVLLLCITASVARAEFLPAPPIGVTLPPPAANAFGVAVAFGPADGLMYVWDGAAVLKQDAPLSASFTSIGSVGTGSADAGPIAFSSDGANLLIGNGSGGGMPAGNAGLIFTIPAAGGSIATVDYHAAFAGAPLAAAETLFFINQGNASFSASSVSVFGLTGHTNVPVIENIPGASTSIAVDATRLVVGVGFGPQVGYLRSFDLADLQTAYDTTTPLDWTAGALLNDQSNNSGFGLLFDARGYLFAGGPDGVTVFDTLGGSRLYENNGFTEITYDPFNDRVLVTGFGDHQGLYPASMFLVPEPATLAMALAWALVLIPRWRRAGRRVGAVA